MANCTCVYADYSDNLPEPFSSVRRKARILHVCCECRHSIWPGEIYFSDSGKWDGKWATFKVCSSCMEILNAFFCEGYAYREMKNDLYEHIQEMNGQISESCLADLSPKARETVCDLIDEYWEHYGE